MIRSLLLLILLVNSSIAGDVRIAGVQCDGGVCLLVRDSGFGDAVLVPQSTAFFALSNQNVFFKTRQFVIPHHHGHDFNQVIIGPEFHGYSGLSDFIIHDHGHFINNHGHFINNHGRIIIKERLLVPTTRSYNRVIFVR